MFNSSPVIRQSDVRDSSKRVAVANGVVYLKAGSLRGRHGRTAIIQIGTSHLQYGASDTISVRCGSMTAPGQVKPASRSAPGLYRRIARCFRLRKLSPRHVRWPHLLANELAHTLQQRSVASSGQRIQRTTHFRELHRQAVDGHGEAGKGDDLKQAGGCSLTVLTNATSCAPIPATPSNLVTTPVRLSAYRPESY